MRRVRIAQYGTTHGHAAGVLDALISEPVFEVTGVYEPDAARRTELANSPHSPWCRVSRWYEDGDQMLQDRTVSAVAVESLNVESLEHARQVIHCGKHLLMDKPAGTSYDGFMRLVEQARSQKLCVQLGYMFRYHEGFQQVAAWARSGRLGKVFSIRAQMSTDLDDIARRKIAVHRGGILFDLGGHMIDQIVWILGRPPKVHRVLQHDVAGNDGLADNAVAILEYPQALAVVEISAMEPPPPARRYEVYGIRGSAVLEPFEPEAVIRFCVRTDEPNSVDDATVRRIPLKPGPRYRGMVVAFADAICGVRPPDRSLEHELLVHETLLRATGELNA